MSKALIAAATAAALLAGCAGTAHRHDAGGGKSMPMGDMHARGGMPMDMEKHMREMRQFHEKMAAAQTPAERQGLMQEHRKLMQDMMADCMAAMPSK